MSTELKLPDGTLAVCDLRSANAAPLNLQFDEREWRNDGCPTLESLHPGYVKLRADLATVTAERDRWEREFMNQCGHSAEQLVELTAMRRKLRETPSVVEHELLEAEYETERAAHANVRAEWLSTRAELVEVRKALEESEATCRAVSAYWQEQIDSTRTELSAAQERVKTLEAELEQLAFEARKWKALCGVAPRNG